ncbi:hypothetical protein [Caenimonas terrae]|uniref:hypothetical protein n=1 Tax=Caenimonas terrae TaxID=696074 RepID=UPI00366C0EFF
MQDKGIEGVTPKDYGAAADGVTVDVVAIRKAFAASKTVRFSQGTYNFGDIGANGVLVDLTALGPGITMIVDAGAEFLCNTTDNTLTAFFLLESNSHFTVKGTASFRDTGYNGLSTPIRGAVGFLLTNHTAHNWGDVNIEAIHGHRIVAPLLINGTVSAADRVRDIVVGHIVADDCYYGFNAQNQGDRVGIGKISAYRCYRPYFVYGVTAHEVEVVNRAPRSNSGAVNISRSDGGLPTRGIRVRYSERENVVLTTTAHVLINHIGPSLGEISGIHVTYDIEDLAGAAPPVKIVTYTAPGGVETNALLANVVDDVHISGKCVGRNGAVTCTANYTAKGRLHWGGGPGSSYDGTIPKQFRIDDNYAPA